MPLHAEVSEGIQDVTDNDPATASAKLATIMAVMSREAHQIGNGVPNKYVQALESVSDLEAFAAVIYSSNFELEASADGLQQSIASQPSEGPFTEAEEPPHTDIGRGFAGTAAGVVDAAWSGFESVWGKVTDDGQNPTTG